jgi:hypothetical protein
MLERIERLERGASSQAAGPAVTEAREALGAVKKTTKKAAPPEPTKAEPPNAVESPKRSPRQGAPFPTRDDLTTAWADEVLPKLSQRARARFRVGRWVGADGEVATFALPNTFHRDKAEDVRLEVEESLSEHYGTRVPLQLVVDDGAPATAPDAAGTPPSDEEHVDPDELHDAPPGLASPEDRLKDAFPGAEEVHT